MHPAILLIAVLLMTQATPTVTVATDQGWYSPGDQVTVQVTARGMPWNETLWLYVDEPDGRNLYFAELPANGGTINLTLPQDAADGSYTVTIMWDHRYVQTGFIVQSQPIPEFPFPLVVLLLAVATAVAAISWRKTGASAETTVSDS
jgi:hypothetical protein